MNKDNAKEYLPFVQALAEGKTIQVEESDGAWKDLDAPRFDGMPEYYRIKPEPRDVWVNQYENGLWCAYDSKEEAVAAAGKSATRVAVHYREVQEMTP